MQSTSTRPTHLQHTPAPAEDLIKNQLTKMRLALNSALTASRQYQSADWWKSLPEVKAYSVQETLKNGKGARSVAFAGPLNPCLQESIASLGVEAVPLANAEPLSCDLILATHSLDGELAAILKASEELLLNPSLEVLQRHPLYQMIGRLQPKGSLLVTLNSGPNIQDFTNIMLQKHDLDFQAQTPNLKIFSNVETFLRCYDIFKRHYEQLCGKSLSCDVSYSLPKIPLKTFCEGYVGAFPEIIKLPESERERFVKLLTAFTVNDHVVDCHLTLKISPTTIGAKRSFKPVGDFISYRLQHKQTGSNESSFGQLDLTKQIQNLNGSEISIPYMKETDGEAQYQAIQRLFQREKVNMLDIGGSYGETNALPQALAERGVKVNLLNIDPEKRTFESYAKAHKRVGIQQVTSLPKRSQELNANEVIAHFGGEKVDLLLSSHALYFEIADLMQASLDPSRPLCEHPLYKYFQMLGDQGVFVVTMQTGAGSRVFRNALLGEHGLDGNDDIAPIIESFKNIGSALRYLEQFKERYKQETGKSIHVKLHHAVANVPLGNILSPQENPESLERRMLDYYGNWESLNKTIQTSPDAALREKALKSQKIFLHILRAFAPGLVNMQHPNITLEITTDLNG